MSVFEKAVIEEMIQKGLILKWYRYVDDVICIIKTECKDEIYQKINEKGTPFEEIDDLIGVRVLVNRDIDCYTAIGAIHTRWRHVPERFKDFVSFSHCLFLLQNRFYFKNLHMHRNVVQDGINLILGY